MATKLEVALKKLASTNKANAQKTAKKPAGVEKTAAEKTTENIKILMGKLVEKA